MQLEYDETQWPQLGRFRQACLAESLDEMNAIAGAGFHWYANENPAQLPMSQLAKVFQAQHLASENSLEQLQELIDANPWLVNHPWTSQRWLPITQACAHGDREMFKYLLAKGADPNLLVGDQDEEGNVVDMARYGGNHELATWLEGMIGDST
jgi:hypothetical protein